MKRVLYVTILLAILAIPVSTAFAAEPTYVEQIPDGQWILGEIWWTPAYVASTPLWLPFERVDAYMTRVSTLAGWPFAWGPIGGPGGAAWWIDDWSMQRRMSYAEDWWYANEWGGYYAEFMLPRDEVWFPCSYPLKWKCNFELAPGIWELHSPAFVDYEGMWLDPFTYVELYWPWIDWFGPVAEVQDVISPVVIDVANFEAAFPYGYQYELEIAGYFWKFSDIP
jgi:hypothetical protein